MKFGFFEHIDHHGPSLARQYDDRYRLIEAADRLGFHAYHLAEHHGTPLGGAPSPALFLSGVAARTKRLRLGPLVYLLPLYHPVRLIEEICMLDQLSHGRLELGIGRGGAPVEHALYGISTEPADLARRFAEVRDIVLLGLRSDELNYDGEFFQLTNVPMVLKPIQRPHPPLWYGTANPESAAWTVPNNVNVLTLGPTSRARTVGDAYRAEWKTQGRDPNAMPFLGMTRHLVVADTDAAALSIGKRAYDDFNAKLRWLWDKAGQSAAFPAHFVPDFDVARAAGLTFAGTPAKARDYVAQQIAESGITYLAAGFAYGAMSYEEAAASIELFAKEVMPEFTNVSPHSSSRA
jgi:alkanesulfonate monooxygenase SsuD/methylene tetrahydromethanopterin reductase-like flavin-dependent oxidoreductase (luciferase family)